MRILNTTTLFIAMRKSDAEKESDSDVLQVDRYGLSKFAFSPFPIGVAKSPNVDYTPSLDVRVI